MHTTVIELADVEPPRGDAAAGLERYRSLFEATPDALIQQSPYWAEVIRSIGPDRPYFLLCSEGGDDRGGLPLYLFQHELGSILTSVPQAGPLGGVFARPGLTTAEREAVYAALLEGATALAGQLGVMALTVITNPFVDDIELYRRFLKPDYTLENFTQWVPLGSGPGWRSRLHTKMRTNLRRKTRRANEEGFSLRLCQGPDDLRRWYEVHRKRHAELGVSPIAWSLFAQLLDRLATRDKAHCLLAERDGEIASGCFYVHHREVLDVYMLSVDSRFANSGLNTLITERSLDWAEARGVRIYNWQSSQDRRCGVFRFKEQWGSACSTYCFVTRLFCAPERIRRIGLDGLRNAYRGHYVVPHQVFAEGFDRRYFVKG